MTDTAVVETLTNKTISYTSNTITNLPAITGAKYGTSTTNGGSTTVSITHGLGSTPNFVMVGAQSADALGPFYYTVSSTTITVTYGSATPSGTSNVVLAWFVTT